MATQPPNILWICTDQQRHDTIGALGNPHIHTPSLDRLVAEGVAFTSAYCQTPICTPSRASFLTGRYPSHVGVNSNSNARFPDDAQLVTRTLADAGYDCGMAGKLHLSTVSGRVEPRPDDGYRVFRWSHHPRPETYWGVQHHAYHQWLEKQGVNWFDYYPNRPWSEKVHASVGAGIEPRYHQTTWCADEAISFMSEPREGPWLMSVNPFDPHPQGAFFSAPREYLDKYDPAALPGPHFRESDLAHQARLRNIDFQSTAARPEEYPAREMQAAYYASIELIDAQVGRMLEALERSGQRENTVVIFMSDHGEMLGDHGLTRKGCRFYEGLAHVPLIISSPSRFRQGVRSGALVELIDIVPTLLQLAGLDVPDDVQGQSLLPILTGGSAADSHRDVVRCEYRDALDMPGKSHADMIFDGRYKLVVYHGTGLGELFDLEEDPHEFDNLWDAAEAAGIKQKLLIRLFDDVVLAANEGQPRIANV
ncbi:MAG: sulfatase-like hydrolase/transferase [Candidatus Poribacteria bacterium]|nr:sulfatase-like hydrolase/transferase [Candidatus Poribacteria bacterium]MDE0503297.1 sulfatase-like hydrolase/transferase [Candidatus Poribacteria bacterium]